jgi:hypothetical protein
MRPRRSLALGAAAAVAAVAAALAAARPVTVLEIENAARGRTFRAALAEGEPFSVVYHHSMYDAPVVEELALEDGRVVLRAVESRSAAVREYFGLTAAGERHAVARAMAEVVFRVATGTPQRLRLGGGERSFLELGEPGDRLVMRAARRPAAEGWLAALAAATLRGRR